MDIAKTASALKQRGDTAFRQGNYALATEFYTQAIDTDHDNQQTRLARELETVKKVVKAGMERPINSLVFERAWREYGAHPELLYEYLRHISAEELPMLFRTSLESWHIAQIAAAAEYAQSERNDETFGATLLGALPGIERFGLAVLFLGEGDRHSVQKIIKSSECEHVLAAQYE
ncbi:hypothetical protein LPJ66_003657 [Kickxella alabastrina]|uniref:Uncharacterized protein n=1 Tax=Kickxella alabastrina TaxID=61397 RepID=A0ACC1IK36_9FUNG|nr:hypothetical protein LPJ66_003657 [Kickxella alabastrina]